MSKQRPTSGGSSSGVSSSSVCAIAPGKLYSWPADLVMKLVGQLCTEL